MQVNRHGNRGSHSKQRVASYTARRSNAADANVIQRAAVSGKSKRGPNRTATVSGRRRRTVRREAECRRPPPNSAAAVALRGHRRLPPCVLRRRVCCPRCMMAGAARTRTEDGAVSAGTRVCAACAARPYLCGVCVGPVTPRRCGAQTRVRALASRRVSQPPRPKSRLMAGTQHEVAATEVKMKMFRGAANCKPERSVIWRRTGRSEIGVGKRRRREGACP